MFEGISTFFKRILKPGQAIDESSKDTAKERLHLVLMQDRANVSADFLDLMKQEIIDVIKKYIVVDEKEIDVRLTNQSNDDGTNGAPALYANIPIINIKNEVKAEKMSEQSNASEPKDEKKAKDGEKENKPAEKKDSKKKVQKENVVEEKASEVSVEKTKEETAKGEEK